MKTLVIHPKDNSTDFLSDIYGDKDWTVLNTNVSNTIIVEQINLHDRIVMLGHGTPDGLLGFYRLVIDKSHADILRTKECVGIWCNADMFFTKYDLKGFYSGMIISEYEEAIIFNINTNNVELLKSNTLLATAIKQSIDSDNIVFNVKEMYKGDEPVIRFNEKNLYYKSVLL